MKKKLNLFVFIISFFLFCNINLLYSQLSAPLLDSPGNGVLNMWLAPYFMWDPVENANSYILQISSDENFNNLFIEINNTPWCSYILSTQNALEQETLYYWRVRAINESQISEWSEIWNFTTANINMAIPYLISPLDNQQNIQIPTLLVWEETWLPFNNYQIQISTNSGFSTDTTTNETQILITDLSYQTTYYWRVRAFDGIIYGFWSEMWSFTTEPAPISNINIPLNTGWNLISSNVITEEPAMESVFSGTNNIVLVKNGAGQIYSNAFGINEIGDWNINDGYYVYTNAGSIFNIYGAEVIPSQKGIELNAGWNLVSYLRNSPMNVQQALSSILSNLVMAKNNSGGIYHPGFGINTLGEMQPGQGYWIYLSAPAVLNYPGN